MFKKLTISGIYEAGLWEDTHTKIIGIVDPLSKRVHTTKPYHVEEFHDIDEAIERFIPATIENVENTLNFSKSFTDDDKVLIHCQAGISRSTAMAILVLIQHGSSIEDAFKIVYDVRPVMNPNKLLLNFGDSVLNLGGELVNYYEKWAIEKKTSYTKFAGQTWYM
jgi:predicted protein tyrosine phosphatase